METATRNATAGVAAVTHPQTEVSACARFAARDNTIPPTRTRVGQDTRPERVRPVFLSRCRSRAAMTQVRSTQTATAQAIQPLSVRLL
ncbi:hypothetical protein AB0O34_29335 [Sphaerisporangium sp. NPDC088356]|uniref:hypothetical protein n=1 Tax=Sphaerisporangium sp. NPDC088356 TaxID=3154871 RepID=UPI00342A8107